MLTVKRRFGMLLAMAKAQRGGPGPRPAAIAAWLENYNSPHTRAAYRADIEHFGQWARAEHVDPVALEEADLRRYRAACEASGAGPSTVARRLSAISSFGAFAFQDAGSRSVPVIDRPTLPTVSHTESLSADDADAILAAADRMNPRSALLIRLLMLDGLKVGEAVDADATDVAGRPPRMTLRLHTTTPRVISLHPDTAMLLAAYLGKRRRGPLLLSEHRARVTERLTRFGVDYVVKQAAQTAGIGDGVSGNTLRRRFVIAAHDRGENIDDIRENLGHAHARTTRRYMPHTGGDDPRT